MRTVTVICRPGSALGPCKRQCRHVACRSAKAVAASACPLCGEAVGYYAGLCEWNPGREDGRRWCHSVCLDRRRRRLAAVVRGILRRNAAKGRDS